MQPLVKAVRKAIDADNKSGNFLTSGRLKDGSVFERQDEIKGRTAG
jgi:hypothetical protein